MVQDFCGKFWICIYYLLVKLCTETVLCKGCNAFGDDMDCKRSKDMFVHIV
jgi:hypothetical protein